MHVPTARSRPGDAHTDPTGSSVGSRDDPPATPSTATAVVARPPRGARPPVRPTRRGWVPETSRRDARRVVRRVLAPLVGRGIVVRRDAGVARAAARQDDARVAAVLTATRAAYGPDPRPVRLLGRRLALVLSQRDVRRIVEDTPEPFSPATREKRAALRHFQPHSVLLSTPVERPVLRAFHESALQSQQPTHSVAALVRDAVRTEVDALLDDLPPGGEVDWDSFAVASWRAVRSLMFGPQAADDTTVTDLLRSLRADANWAFLRPRRRALRRTFERELTRAMESADPRSLAGHALRAGADHGVDPVEQVPQWLFAFDAVVIATCRALALVGARPDLRRAVAQEVQEAPGDAVLARASLLESLRLWPTTLAILRDTTRATPWRTGILRRGTGLVIVSSFFHRDPARVPFADVFAPEAWLDGRAERHPGIVPFSAGPAACPGRRVAELVGSELLAAAAARLRVVDPLPLADLPRTLDHTSLRFTVVDTRTDGSAGAGTGAATASGEG